MTGRGTGSSDNVPEKANGTRSKSTERASKVSKDKQSKGLRHFAVRVCSKVEEKHITSYNEVADDLVSESLDDVQTEDMKNKKKSKGGREFDEKNIRRRVYDALNVLMALDIVVKNKKEIRWNGLPSAGGGGEDLDNLRKQIEERKTSIAEKNAKKAELESQKMALMRLTRRNRAKSTDPSNRIEIPFIVVRTNALTEIDLEIEQGREAVCFSFDRQFQIEDDQSIMRLLGIFEESDRVEGTPERRIDRIFNELTPPGAYSSLSKSDLLTSPDERRIDQLYSSIHSPELLIDSSRLLG